MHCLVVEPMHFESGILVEMEEHLWRGCKLHIWQIAHHKRTLMLFDILHTQCVLLDLPKMHLAIRNESWNFKIKPDWLDWEFGKLNIGQYLHLVDRPATFCNSDKLIEHYQDLNHPNSVFLICGVWFLPPAIETGEMWPHCEHLTLEAPWTFVWHPTL